MTAAPPAASLPRTTLRARDRCLCLALLCLTIAIYLPVRHFDFVNFDDRIYVQQNPHVRFGLRAESVKWALSSTEDGYWYPLTRLSQLVDATLFGITPGYHHLTNVFLHSLAILLLFVFVRRATGVRWKAAFVAFLFALHPCHVESVAWIAERSDVLCAVFWFLTLLAWVRYVERPDWRRYLPALAFFGLGILAKPVIVTLPCALLILDAWPFCRGFSTRLLLEKLPFFALAGGCALTVFLTQHAMGAVVSLGTVPLSLRLENILITWVVFLGKFFWPAGLSAYYLYPKEFPLWHAILSGLLLASLTIAVFRVRRRFPYLFAGWLWYLVTFLPMVGLVQVGTRARTDHSTYIPFIGLSLAVAWAAGDLARRWQPARLVLASAGVIACAGLAWGSAIQLPSWRNTETLFRRAVAADPRNDEAWRLLGEFLAESPDRLPDAVIAGRAAVRIRPDAADPHCSLGTELLSLKNTTDAIREFRAALRIAPHFGPAHNQLGLALATTPAGLEEAVQEFRAALRDGPAPNSVHNRNLPVLSHRNLAAALRKLGRLPEAIAEAEAAVVLDPNDAEAQNMLGSILNEIPNRVHEAVDHLESAVLLDPGNSQAHNNLGVALVRTPGRGFDARMHFEEAIRLDPDFLTAHLNLAKLLIGMERPAEAARELKAALRIQPDPGVQHALDELEQRLRQPQ